MEKEFCAQIEEWRKKVEELKFKRDGYATMEEGIKILEKFNKEYAHKLEIRKVFPVMFFEDHLPDIRESGIYKSDVADLTRDIINLNKQIHECISKSRRG